MIAVVDYGASNLRSVLRALRAAGVEADATADPDAVRRAERVVVPGVGHFAPAAQRLAETGLGAAVSEVAHAGRPVLGICLGLQLFLAGSEEAPDARGLGLLRGRAIRFRTDLPVPHVGWSRVELTDAGRAHPALAPAFFYHVHSYHPDAVSAEDALAQAEYGAPFATVVGRDNVLGVQFHPEKSQAAGLALLGAFARWAP
ncbi:MAG TPA: imidazole glycerol phosphate synthase subunit HisH [Gemmatimonadales bacterium]|jgi:glutamine amidotransferase